jgi:maltose-binding protein MalE
MLWATHDVKVELRYVPVQEYLGGSKLQTAFAAGQGPDIFLLSHQDFLLYYNGGVLLDLTPYMEDAAKKDFFPSVMGARIVDEKIYGVPFDVEPMAMYYRGGHAHLLLQTRTRVLNEDLDDLFRRWYPKFRPQPQTQEPERNAA